jgi:hypothetical protein
MVLALCQCIAIVGQGSFESLRALEMSQNRVALQLS